VPNCGSLYWNKPKVRLKVTEKKQMSDETFKEVKRSFEEALEHARGERDELNVTRIELPDLGALKF
jgi:ribosomal protein L18E